MKKIITLAFIVISYNSFGQQVTFQKTYGGITYDGGSSIQQTADGGYIVCGFTRGFDTANVQKIYLLKTDTNGDTLWTKTFVATFPLIFTYVQQTADGGYIISTNKGSPQVGDNFFLIKTDANGDTLWTKSYGSTADEQSYAGAQQTSDGGYIITGETETVNFTPLIYLIKTDVNGILLWTKTYDISNQFPAEGESVRQVADGGYIIAGWTQIALNYSEAYLMRTDSAGNPLWSKSYGGTYDDDIHSVKQTTDGGYILAGETSSFGAGSFDAYLIKTDANGDTLWTKTYGGINYEKAQDVQQTTDGGFIIIGITTSFGAGDWDFYLVKTDSTGNMVWTKTFGGAGFDWSYSVQQTSNGGYILTGLTDSYGAGYWDVYLIKIDSSGNTGCNPNSTATIVSATATQVLNIVPVVSSLGTASNPGTIVGSGGIVTTLCSSVGIQSAIQNPQSEISISPNPATNNFTITFPNTIHKGSIEIYDVMGKKIYKENIDGVSQKEIRFKNIVAGIYFVKVKDGEKEYCKKLVME
jgi:Secretion system C-terminal sorting domain